MKKSDIQNRALEVTVFDYDRIGSGEYVGEVAIDLASADLYDEPQFYTLRHHDDAAGSAPGSKEVYYHPMYLDETVQVPPYLHET